MLSAERRSKYQAERLRDSLYEETAMRCRHIFAASGQEVNGMQPARTVEANHVLRKAHQSWAVRNARTRSQTHEGLGHAAGRTATDEATLILDIRNAARRQLRPMKTTQGERRHSKSG